MLCLLAALLLSAGPSEAVGPDVTPLVLDSSSIAIDSRPEWLIDITLHIEKLTELVQTIPPTLTRAHRMIELASLYRERALHYRDAARPSSEERRVLHGAPNASGEQLFPILAEHPFEKLAETDLKKSIAITEHVLTKYPRAEVTELATELVIRAYLEIEKLDKATAHLLHLEDLDPRSQEVARSLIAVADYELTHGRPVDAQAHYRKVVEMADSPLKVHAESKIEECRQAIGAQP